MVIELSGNQWRDKMVNFIAKRSVGELKLYDNKGFHFGSLKDCEACWLFESSDDQLEYYVNARLSGDMSPYEMLPIVKEVTLAVWEQYAAEIRAEQASERAMYNQLEYNAEHQAEMEYDDAMGKS